MTETTRTRVYTLRDGEGFTVGEWSLTIKRLQPFPLAEISGPPGRVKQGMFSGCRFVVGPAAVRVTDCSVDGLRRVRFVIVTPLNVDVRPLKREE